jgi:hypothetical protein
VELVPAVFDPGLIDQGIFSLATGAPWIPCVFWNHAKGSAPSPETVCSVIVNELKSW